MNRLNNTVPPPVVALLFALLIWLIATTTFTLDIPNHWRIFLAGSIVACGIIIDLSAIVAFRRAHTTINPLRPNRASTLVVTGIYRISRNPMYLGLMLFLIALTVYLAAPFAVIGVVGFAFYLQRFQILPEEQAMHALFGSDYRLYSKDVRRWL